MELRDYAVFVGGIAGVAGFVLSLITLLMKGGENRRTIRSQLTDVLSRLNTVNAESRKFRIETADKKLTPEISGMFSFYNDQRSFLVGQATYLVEQIPKHVSHSEFAVIARAFGSFGDHEKACHYWERCLSCAKSDYAKGLHSRGFAGYLFDQGYYDLARQKFEESISFTSGSDDRNTHTRGETFHRWALAERAAHFYDEAEHLLVRSKLEFDRVQSVQLKKHGIQLVECTPALSMLRATTTE